MDFPVEIWDRIFFAVAGDVASSDPTADDRHFVVSRLTRNAHAASELFSGFLFCEMVRRIKMRFERDLSTKRAYWREKFDQELWEGWCVTRGWAGFGSGAGCFDVVVSYNDEVSVALHTWASGKSYEVTKVNHSFWASPQPITESDIPVAAGRSYVDIYGGGWKDPMETLAAVLRQREADLQTAVARSECLRAVRGDAVISSFVRFVLEAARAAFPRADISDHHIPQTSGPAVPFRYVRRSGGRARSECDRDHMPATQDKREGQRESRRKSPIALPMTRYWVIGGYKTSGRCPYEALDQGGRSQPMMDPDVRLFKGAPGRAPVERW
jgi:hypothetical protein